MGFFGGLNAEKYDRQYSDRQLMGRITEYFKPQSKRLIAISTLVVTIAVVGAMLPVVVSRIVDLLEEQPTVQAIGLAGLALVLVGVGIWGLNWVRRALVVSQDFDATKADLEITSMGPGWLEITASSEVEYVYRFRKFTEMLLRRKVPNDTLEDLRLAVEEIGRNAVEWGNEFAENKRVKLGYKFANNQIIIKVEDEGKGFNPDDVEDPSHDPVAAITRRLEAGKRPGGYGIKIVKKTMDEVKYSDGGTSVLMVKNVPPMDD